MGDSHWSPLGDSPPKASPGHVAFDASGDDVRPPIALENIALGGAIDWTFRGISYWEPVQHASLRRQPETMFDRLRSCCFTGDSSESSLVQRLTDLHGRISPGKLTLVVGPNAAILFNLWSGRKSFGIVAGALVACPSLELEAKTLHALQQRSGFISSEPALLPGVTIETFLRSQARMSIPKLAAESRAAHFARCVGRVDAVIELFGLDPSLLIGAPAEGSLTCLEVKLVSLAAEMLNSPPVLFVDDPGCTLTSSETSQLMSVLSQLSSSEETTVLCSCASIGTDELMIADELLLLVDDRLVYEGPAGTAAVSYFEGCGFKRVAGGTPGAFLMSISPDKASQDHAQTIPDIAKSLKETILAGANRGPDELPRRNVIPAMRTYRNSFLHNFVVQLGLMARVRSRIGFFIKPVSLVLFFMAIIATTIVGEQAENNNERLARFAGLFISSFVFLVGPIIFARHFIAERRNAVRESVRGVCHPSAYQLASTLVDFVLITIVALLWGIPLYAAVPYYYAPDHMAMFFLFLGALMVDGALGVAFVKVLADFKDTSRGMATTMMYISLVALFFGNFFVRFPQIPVYWVWCWYANPLQYSFGALLVNEVYNSPTYYEADAVRSTLISYGYWVVADDGTDRVLMNPPAFVGILFLFTLFFTALGFIVLSMRKQ